MKNLIQQHRQLQPANLQKNLVIYLFSQNLKLIEVKLFHPGMKTINYPPPAESRKKRETLEVSVCNF